MHMADALLAPAVAATMYVASGAAAGISINKLKKDDEPQKLPVMAVTAALVFAGQMINYTIPGTGSSGHMCGGMLLSALLGPQAGFLSMIVILAIQCLFFADGGLMAFGSARARAVSVPGSLPRRSSAASSRCSWARSPSFWRPASPASRSCPSALSSR